MSNKNFVQKVADRMMGGIETDHGGVTLGDVVVLILDVILLGYTGYRSWHFLSVSIPADFQILALVGLFGIDIGMIAWSIVWVFGSTTKAQDGVAMTMWVVDVVGMVLTSVVDTILYADSATAGIPPIMQMVAWYGIPIIIVGNAIMGVIYHFTSPDTLRRREARRQEAKLAALRNKGHFDVQEIEQTTMILKETTGQRALAVATLAKVVEQNRELVEMEHSLVDMLNQVGLGEYAQAIGRNPKATQEGKAEDDAVDALLKKTAAVLQHPKAAAAPAAPAGKAALPHSRNNGTHH